jgi:uracil-DNA glycosylase family 4
MTLNGAASMSILQRETVIYDRFANLLKESVGWADDRIALALSDVSMEVADTMPKLSILEIEDMVLKCRACYGKSLVTEHGPVPGRGNKANIDILFAGLMPGNTEEETGKIFTGPNSEILIKSMQELGIGGKDCPIYAHNLVCCMPSGKTPKVQQVHNCGPFLAELVWALQPNLMVTLGTDALSFFLGKAVKLQDYEAQVLMQGGYIIIPLKHPSALHRIPDAKEQKAAFSKYRQQLAGVKRVNDRIKKLRQEGSIPERGTFQEAYESIDSGFYEISTQ